jgi:hypothetical protein
MRPIIDCRFAADEVNEEVHNPSTNSILSCEHSDLSSSYAVFKLEYSDLRYFNPARDASQQAPRMPRKPVFADL